MSIFDIFKREANKFVFDCLNLNNPTQFHNYYVYPPNKYNTSGNRNKHPYIPIARTKTYRLNSITNAGAHAWNDIPLEIRSIATRGKPLMKY